VSFAAITLCVASQRVFIVVVVVVYFVIDSARKLLNTPSYVRKSWTFRWIVRRIGRFIIILMCLY
jgi:hypothetical protein